MKTGEERRKKMYKSVEERRKYGRNRHKNRRKCEH